TVTTHADRSYPFCEPSYRCNTTLDFYHLLLTARCSPNKEQVFLSLGLQEAGEFMRGGDATRPMGHCNNIVYRSWAFLQRQAVEEFATDDGVPYWFDRRTGDTFWERPLAPEEKVPVSDGGTVLDGRGEAPDTIVAGPDVPPPRYDQRQMRRLMRIKHEAAEEVTKRRQVVSQSIKWAQRTGMLPPPLDDGGDDSLPPESERSEDARAEEGLRLESHPAGRSCDANGGKAASGMAAATAAAAAAVASGGARPHTSGSSITAAATAAAAGGDTAVPPHTDAIVRSITEALAGTRVTDGRGPEDLLRLGMGLGMSLARQGLLDRSAAAAAGSAATSTATDGADSDGIAGAAAMGLSAASDSSAFSRGGAAAASAQVQHGAHPIGHGHTAPTNVAREVTALDHSAEAKQRAAAAASSLSPADEFKGLVKATGEPQPTLPPDEDFGQGWTSEELEADPRRKAELATPLVAHPGSSARAAAAALWRREHGSHPAAGVGESWAKEGRRGSFVQQARSAGGAALRRTREPVSVGFVNAIRQTHVGRQHVDYLPHVPNLPRAKPVGRIRPRSAADDWFAVGFDPWSAGREPLLTEFIPTLTIKQEDLAEEGRALARDPAAHAELAVVSAEEAKMARDFETLSSWARHGRFADIATAMAQPDWAMPVDYQDAHGSTLLHVAAQNGNK
ncbi:unnamed protein product, partial [Phaeothamnion confervicola]